MLIFKLVKILGDFERTEMMGRVQEKDNQNEQKPMGKLKTRNLRGLKLELENEPGENHVRCILYTLSGKNS